MILVSACLANIKCNWKGAASPLDAVIKLVKNGKAIPICPEQLGGLTTPRPRAEQQNDCVITVDGKDVTVAFTQGAHECLRIAQCYDCKQAILKSRSPSCGCGKVYDGSFSGKLVPGDGVLTKLLKQNGITVITDEEFLLHASD